MDQDQKRLLEALRDLGGSATFEAIAQHAYFPSSTLQLAGDALIADGMIEPTYPGDNPGYQWSEAFLTPLGQTTLDSL